MIDRSIFVWRCTYGLKAGEDGAVAITHATSATRSIFMQILQKATIPGLDADGKSERSWRSSRTRRMDLH